MSNELALWLSIGAGAIAVLFGLITTQWILKQPAGNDRMQEIAKAIQEGAGAYMNRQYGTISIVGIVLFIILGFGLDWYTATGFAIGAIFRPSLATSACTFRYVPTYAQPRPQPRASIRP